jgi:hypothetical protein
MKKTQRNEQGKPKQKRKREKTEGERRAEDQTQTEERTEASQEIKKARTRGVEEKQKQRGVTLANHRLHLST